MRSRLFHGCLLAFLAAIGPGALGQELDWVNSALPERSFDFGTVARGSKLRHAFPIVNRSDQTIQIRDWKTKCGCTDVKVGAKVIPPGTQTTVEITIDTTQFLGAKPSGLTLVFDQPTFVEADLNTTCFIRGDIVMNPGQLDFGIVRRGETPPTAELTLTYAGGRSDWEVTKMRTRTDKIKAELRELNRTVDGQINFRLTATLQPNVPNGYFKDEITLSTNDESSPAIPVSVVATVQSAVALTPAIINFGQVSPGQSVSKTVLVRSSKAFAITEMAADESALKAEDRAKGAQPLHQVTLTFTAPDRPGPFHSNLTVKTDIADEPDAILKAFATVAR